jgi:hypothetical protein
MRAVIQLFSYVFFVCSLYAVLFSCFITEAVCHLCSATETGNTGILHMSMALYLQFDKLLL